jgi:hypothetical protein
MFKKLKKVTAVILTLMMVLTMMPANVFAVGLDSDEPLLLDGITINLSEYSGDGYDDSDLPDSETSSEIIAFAPLTDDVAFQIVPLDTELSSLYLPESLMATVRFPSLSDEPDNTSNVDVPVTWRSSPEYEGDVPGAYIFTPLIGDEFIVNAALPHIEVTVDYAEAGFLSIMPLSAGLPLVFGQQYTGTLSPTNPSDSHTVILTEPGRLRIQIANGGGFPNSTADSFRVRWNDATSANIRTETHWFGSASNAYNSFIDLETGTYQIIIERVGTQAGTYLLTPTFTVANTADWERGMPRNFARTNAYSPLSSEATRGLISHQNNTSFYSFTLTEAGRLRIQIANTHTVTLNAGESWIGNTGTGNNVARSYAVTVTWSEPVTSRDVVLNTSAVEWAADMGIVTGIGNNMFAPNANVTREQMAVMLYNYINFKGISLPVNNIPAAFADEGEISSWAINAVKSIQAAGIISGRPGNLFDPQATATRAEVATIFARFITILSEYALDDHNSTTELDSTQISNDVAEDDGIPPVGIALGFTSAGMAGIAGVLIGKKKRAAKTD